LVTGQIQPQRPLTLLGITFHTLLGLRIEHLSISALRVIPDHSMTENYDNSATF
jgi:hypothetical protein